MKKSYKKVLCAKGQGLTEYAIILSLVAVAAIVTTALFGGAIKSKIASLTGAISGQSTSQISSSENQAKSAAKKAQQNAKSVTNMSINTSSGSNSADIFDKIELTN
jgi:Flp pilus assembly pilin Flp